MPFPRKPAVNWDLIRQFAVDGVAISELAIRFNLARSTIWFRAKKEAWKLPDTRARQAALALRDPQKKLVLRRSDASILESFANASKMTRADLAVVIQRIARSFKRMPDDSLLDSLPKLKCAAEISNILFGWNGAKHSQIDGLRPDLFALTPDQLAKLAAREVDATAAPLDE